MNARLFPLLAPALLATTAWILPVVGEAAAAAPPTAPVGSRSGEQLVQYQCVLCHGPGLSGAPKIGDGTAWSRRADAGLDNLVRSAARGRGAMPPSGGLADLTENELRAAIAYMLDRSGVRSR